MWLATASANADQRVSRMYGQHSKGCHCKTNDWIKLENQQTNQTESALAAFSLVFYPITVNYMQQQPSYKQ